MHETNIDGVIITPLKTIIHPKGDILHGMKKDDIGYAGFGEAYFSTIKYGEIKGWNRHKEMTLNLVVPKGSVTFIIYDDRPKSCSQGQIFKVKLSVKNYRRLTVPPGLWLAFKGNYANTNLILNIANRTHIPDEIEKLDLNKISHIF
jgi:dTDP-4-dehydrorhamnose 3,5-epimerase